MGLWVLVALIKTLGARESLFSCLLARWRALFHVTRTFLRYLVLYHEEGSIAKRRLRHF